MGRTTTFKACARGSCGRDGGEDDRADDFVYTFPATHSIPKTASPLATIGA